MTTRTPYLSVVSGFKPDCPPRAKSSIKFFVFTLNHRDYHTLQPGSLGLVGVGEGHDATQTWRNEEESNLHDLSVVGLANQSGYHFGTVPLKFGRSRVN